MVVIHSLSSTVSLGTGGVHGLWSLTSQAQCHWVLEVYMEVIHALSSMVVSHSLSSTVSLGTGGVHGSGL